MASDQKPPPPLNETPKDSDDLKECFICCEPLLPSKLFPACDNENCSASICESCGRQWYATNRPGNVINTRRLSCPFCLCTPATNTINNYGNDAVKAVNYLANTFYDHDILYAWCLECQEPRPIAERSCLHEEFELFPKWMCMDCDISRKPELEENEIRWAAEAVQQAQLCGDPVKLMKAEERQRCVFKSIENKTTGIKPCPGCGIPTQRPFECGHLHCTVEGCGTDWCYFCGEAYDKASIYQHMEEAHGDVFGGLVTDRDLLALGDSDTDSDFDPDSKEDDEHSDEDYDEDDDE
ncbi:hypothetical protein N7486_000417 [Penicillium sp. IBT 16267x]|nr:hypothetical protein N7486_000417 [Penicillium sp. IBT 16267x]